MSALSQVIDHLDEGTIRKLILPKTKQLFDINADTKVRNGLGAANFAITQSAPWPILLSRQLTFMQPQQIQITILMCIEKVIENLDKTDILDDVLPMIMRARTQDASVLIIVISRR